MSDLLATTEDILRVVSGVRIEKARDPRKPKDFLTLQNRVAEAIKAHVRERVDLAGKKLDPVISAPWTELSPEAIKTRLDKAADVMRESYAASIPPIIETLQKAGKATVAAVRVSAVSEYKLPRGDKPRSVYEVVDHAVIDHAAKSQALFIRNATGKRLDAWSESARGVVSSGMAQGLGSKDIAQDLKRVIGENIQRTDAYWNVIANVFMARARAYGNLASLQEGGIDYYTFQAVLDEVTSTQCRLMHGRRFSVSAALDKYAKVAAGDPQDVVTEQPWLQTGKDEKGEPSVFYKNKAGDKVHVATVTESAAGKLGETGKFKTRVSDADLQAAGCTVPPLHANCRSTIEPDFSNG